MRFLLIIVGVCTIAYFAGKKAWNAFTMRDAKEASLATLNPLKVSPPPAPSKQPASSEPLAGGSIASSIKQSLDLTSPAQSNVHAMPSMSRVVHFQYRSLPSQETLTAFNSLGLTCILDAGARTAFLRGPFDVVQQVGDMLQASDLVPGFCSMRGWVVWVADADREGWEFTAALGQSLGNEWRVDVTGSDVLLSADVGQISAALSLLSTDSRITVVQEPHVRLTDGVESRIESLEELPIPETTLSNGIASESITYKKVGLELVVKPTFISSNRVRLNVVQIGGVVGRTVEIKGADIPVLQTQKVASDIELAVGQSLVLGGVRSVRTKHSKGWFSRADEIESGTLYVVVALYDDAPRAHAVDAPEWGAEMDGLIYETDKLPWLTDGEVLPPKPSK